MNSMDSSNEELLELYRELILDHARSPRHFGKLQNATHTAEGLNLLCGDELRLYFRIDADNRIEDASFEGSGCAISIASASLLADTVIGLNTAEAHDYFVALVARLTGKQDSKSDNAGPGIDLGKLKVLEGVKEFPARVKCATLAWHALNAAIKRKSEPASTE